MEPRPESLFKCTELIEEFTDPIMYSATDLPEPNYELEYSGSVRIKIWGVEKWFNTSDDDLRKIRHNIVCDVMRESNDVKLSTIGVSGVDGGTTPDYILVNKKVVMEVTTTAGNDESSLKTAYRGKEIKYKSALESVGYQLIPLVVSANKVYTNIILTQKAVNALCLRFRVGRAIEAVLTEKIGTDIFSEDWSSLEDKCKEVMNSLFKFPESTDLFDIPTILSAAGKPSRKDFQRTSVLMKEALRKSKEKTNESEVVLKDYLEQFDENSRTSLKRCCNIPMIIYDFMRYKTGESNIFLDPESSSMPSWLKSLWVQGREVKTEKKSVEDQLLEALKKKGFEKHYVQKASAFNCNLNESERVQAAKSGLFAKSLKENPELLEKEIEDHKSFHPTATPTDDIEDFMNQNLIQPTRSQMCIPKAIWDLLKSAKEVNGPSSISTLVIEMFSKSDFSHFAQGISELFTEICYTYKYWIKRSDFYHKEHKGVHMLIRCTGDHSFVSYAFPKSISKVIDTGRIGPDLYESDNYIFTAFSSYNEPTVEHFVKAGPYMNSILCHLLSHFEVPIQDLTSIPEEMSRTANGILMLYLNNKTDLEELITNQRYLTMGVLEELDPNPFRFVDRLPDVYRSRVTCYFLKQTIYHMRHYSRQSPDKFKTGIEDAESLEYKGILSIFTNKEVSLRQKVNEFYFGYVVSKERGRGSDRNFTIMKKIVAEEYRFRDTVKKTFLDQMEPQMHVSNPVVIRVFMHIYRDLLVKMIGKDWQLVLTRAIIRDFAKKSFYEIATMKVASRTYNEKITVPYMETTDTTHNIRLKLENANENEKKRRPRVMEAIKHLVDEYCATGKSEPEHPIDLLPYCLEKLEKKGYFDSDIFPKPQHGGDREIHVLEISMRIVQLFLESISRTLCTFIPSDSLTHPEIKEKFTKSHYKTANQSLPSSFLTMGKSADATKWCQRHHSSKFAMMLCGVVESRFWGFILRVMSLWQFKRITFPIQFAANFLSNRNTKSNKVYERMRDDFYKGTGVFREAYNNKMWIMSGMMQGILHYTSSFTHGVIQEVMKFVQQEYLNRKGIANVITIVQGSDDSAEMISLSGRKSSQLARIATTMLHWKENISKYFCIYTSRAKSSIGTIDLIEYNSEWHIRSTIIKPTFRWVSACLETGIVEKFVDRYNNMYNTITSVIEGGGKVLEAAMIQICQAWMHYLLLGFHSSDLATIASEYLSILKEPSLGYFALDSDYSAGIPGYNFLLYTLYKKTHYGHGIGRSVMEDVEIDFFEDDSKDPSISKDLRKVRLRFGDHKIFTRILRDMDVPELEKLIEEVEKDPSLLYFPTNDWTTSKFRIFLKVFEPGVKESLSKHSATARMMSASAYMLSRPCLQSPEEQSKSSLFYLICKEAYSKESKLYKPKLPIKDVFLHHKSYSKLLKYIESVEESAILKEQTLKARSKQKIVVFEEEEFGPNLIDMCKRKWFQRGRVFMTEGQFKVRWEEVKKKYPFILDEREHTKIVLGMSDLQLKNFLETQSEKTRSIMLLDTSAKSSNIEASMTRIFWSNTKIMLPTSSKEEETVNSLRSALFSVLTCWLPNTEIKSMISNVLLGSEILSHEQVPSRLDKLKCIRDFIKSRSRNAVLDRVMHHRLGSMGFFTIRQSGWGKKREGYGEWKGIVLDSDVKIEMEGNICTAIHVNRITRAKDLGPALINLVKGFSLNEPTKKSKADYWLSSTGKMSMGKGRKTSIPILVDPMLRVDIIDQMLDYSWDWVIDETKIKIYATVDAHTKITVVSEMLTSSDWDPYHGMSGNREVDFWSRGERIEIDQFYHEFSKILGKRPRHVLGTIKNPSLTSTVNGWNIQKLVNNIKYFYCRSIDLISEPSLADEDESISDVDSIINFMLTSDDNDNELIDFEDNSEDYDPDQFNLEDSDLVELEAQLDVLLQQSNPELDVRLNRTMMPVSNQSLANLNILCRAQLGMSIGEAARKFKENDHLYTYGLLGLILSFLTKRYCIRSSKDNWEKLVEEQEASSISDLTSLRTEADTEDLTEDELKESIEYLETQIQNAPEKLRPKMQHNLKRMKASLRSIRLRVSDADDLDSISASEFFNKLKVPLTDSLKQDGTTVSLSERLYWVQVRNFLDKTVDSMVASAEISPYEHSLYRESIGKTYLTTLLVDVVAMACEITISVLGYTSDYGEESYNI